MVFLVQMAVFFAALMALATCKSNHGRRAFGALLVAWLGYALYEVLMVRRVLCSGECNIRVDLLLIHPALIGGTLWALGAAAQAPPAECMSASARMDRRTPRLPGAGLALPERWFHRTEHDDVA